MPCALVTSARLRQPITLARIVSIWCVSHQSTFGLPVTPAALSTCVGLTRRMSASMPRRSSRRARPYSKAILCSLRYSPSRPPIHPLLPYSRNFTRPWGSEPELWRLPIGSAPEIAPLCARRARLWQDRVTESRCRVDQMRTVLFSSGGSGVFGLARTKLVQCDFSLIGRVVPRDCRATHRDRALIFAATATATKTKTTTPHVDDDRCFGWGQRAARWQYARRSRLHGSIDPEGDYPGQRREVRRYRAGVRRLVVVPDQSVLLWLHRRPGRKSDQGRPVLSQLSDVPARDEQRAEPLAWRSRGFAHARLDAH